MIPDLLGSEPEMSFPASTRAAESRGRVFFRKGRSGKGSLSGMQCPIGLTGIA
jgi:hypothetical protein